MDLVSWPLDGSCPDRIRVHVTRRTVHVQVCGEVDLCTAPTLERVLHEHLGNGRRVIVDLARVRFADCSALGVLLRAHRLDPTLRLFAPSDCVRRLLYLSGVTIPCFGES